MATRKSRKKPLSDRQEKILHYIERCIADGSPPPSVREIGDECEISSTSVVDYNLKRLEAMKYIVRANNISRGIQVLKPIGAMRESETKVLVPLYGSIAAGSPIEVPANDAEPEEEIEVPRELLRTPVGKKLFALRVRGQSMVDALVDDGDIVVLGAQADAETGELVSAWIEERNEWTLKRFYRSQDRATVTLRPANSAAYSEQDIKEKFTFPADQVKISGRVHLVLRQM